jgi:hypothetical protein
MLGISIFSFLAWCFFLISIVGAMLITTVHSPWIRNYRKTLISITLSCLFLGLVSSLTPILIKRMNPIESRLTPLDQLTQTQWNEPIDNPITDPKSITTEEATELEKGVLHFRFRYKIHLPQAIRFWVAAQDHHLIWVDDSGSLRGFDAYQGLNHWSIPMGIDHLVSVISERETRDKKRIFILDRFGNTTSVHEGLRLTCIELQKNPSIIWQRTFPSPTTQLGGLAFHYDTQTLVITTGASGVWALGVKTGEVIWKRPEIFSSTVALHSQKYWIVFEPQIAKKEGTWHWLNDQNGLSASRIGHHWSDPVQIWTTPRHGTTEDSVIVHAQNSITNTTHQVMKLQGSELNSQWSFSLDETTAQDPLSRILPVDHESMLFLYDSSLVELRRISDHSIIWQKRLSGNISAPAELTPDLKFFYLLGTADSQNPEVQFYNRLTGEWVFSTKTTATLKGSQFFGDWFYWFSENDLWAYSKL